MSIRSIVLLSLLSAAPAVATASVVYDFPTLLKLREGLPVEVRQEERPVFTGTLIRVGSDHFCIQFGERDSLAARCYPYTAISVIAPSDPKNPYYIIETR